MPPVSPFEFICRSGPQEVHLLHEARVRKLKRLCGYGRPGGAKRARSMPKPLRAPVHKPCIDNTLCLTGYAGELTATPSAALCSHACKTRNQRTTIRTATDEIETP